MMVFNFFGQICTQVGSHFNEVEMSELRTSIQQFLRWAWRYNKNLEEQAAQLHMLTGWSHIVEVDFWCITHFLSIFKHSFHLVKP